MSLTLVVLTKNPAERFERLMRWASAKPYIDEIHIYIDSSGHLPAIELTGDIIPTTARQEVIKVTNIDAALAYCHSADRIKTDWALHLGDDELMGQWFDEDIERLMQGPYEAYSLPRYNLAPINQNLPEGVKIDILENAVPAYISSPPWYPDWAQRLFRPGSLIHDGKVHEGPRVNGRMSMARPHIFHFDFIDETLEQREEKWQRYLKQGVVEASRERGLEDDYYRRWCVPEDYEYEVAVCEEPL